MPKAIQIATLLGDSVVDVTYRGDPEPKARLGRVLAGFGLGCVVCSAAAFGLGIATAADNDAAFGAWTTDKRPAHAFRPTQTSPLVDAVALGGLALGVCALTGTLLCRRRRTSPHERIPVVVRHGEGFALESEFGEPLVIPENGHVTTRVGNVTFVLSCVSLTNEPLAPQLNARDARPLLFMLGSLAVHTGFLVLVPQAIGEEEPEILTLAQIETFEVPVETTSTSAPPPEPPDAIDEPDDGMVGPGMMLVGRQYVYPVKRERQLVRSYAVEISRRAGILDSPQLATLGRVTGTRNLPDSFSDTINNSGLVGSEAGSMTVGFGFAGVGPEMGGKGWGTIGTGRYGTIGGGHMPLCGPACPGRNRWNHVPTATIGTPIHEGGYDKGVIRRYVKRNAQKLAYCYEKQLLAKPTLEGVVSVTFLIAPRGNVTASGAAGVDEDVSSCVADVIHEIAFPSSRSESQVQVSLPITFRPAGS